MLNILDLFDPDHLRIDADTIADRMSLSKATVYRYVKDLCDAGLLSRAGSGSFGLGPRIIELDWMMRQYDPILIAGRELMDDLSRQTGLAVFASVLYDGHIINTHITDPRESYNFAFGRGRPLPLFRGAQSKVLVAFQNGRKLRRLFDEKISKDPTNTLTWEAFSRAARKIRNDGYCITHDELNLGLTGVAAPIVSVDDKRLVGSISAVGTTATFQLLRQAAVIDMVVQTARTIASRMQSQRIPETG
jgi:DNA-binding IclR family transcriptional regulator